MKKNDQDNDVEVFVNFCSKRGDQRSEKVWMPSLHTQTPNSELPSPMLPPLLSSFITKRHALIYDTVARQIMQTRD